MFMSASDVIYIPDRTKDLASRDKETVLAVVSLENSYITNVQYLNYVTGLSKKVQIEARCEVGPEKDPRSRVVRVFRSQTARCDEYLFGRDRSARKNRSCLRA